MTVESRTPIGIDDDLPMAPEEPIQNNEDLLTAAAGGDAGSERSAVLLDDNDDGIEADELDLLAASFEEEDEVQKVVQVRNARRRP